MSTSVNSTATGKKCWVTLNDRAVISVSGTESREFLQGLVTSDVTKVRPDRTVYGALLTPQGKFLHEFFIAELGGILLLDCDRGRRDDLIRRLTMYKLRAKIEINDAADEFTVVAFPDQQVIDGAEGSAAALGSGIVFVDPRLAAVGARAILPSADAADILTAAGFSETDTEHYEQCRISLGVPDGGRDLVVEKSFLLESNFEELNGVDFEKGCYVGQEVTSRTKHRGLIKKRLLPVEAVDVLPSGGTQVLLDGKDAGTLFSSKGTSGIALLRLEKVEQSERESLEFSAGSTKLRVRVPNWLKLGITKEGRP